MVYTIGPISGCHINPAVGIGVFLAKKINAKDTVAYIVAQIAGAIVADSECIRLLTGFTPQQI